MVNRVDGAILGVGVIVLVASIIGVVLYDEAGGTTFTISWSEESAGTLEEQTDSGGPGEFSFEVPVNGTRIASVAYTVDVSANGAQASDDTVNVEVQGPGGQSASCSFTITAVGGSGGGSCEAVADVTEQPEAFSVTAENETAASQAALDRVANDEGDGDWTVTVTVDGGTELQDPSYSVSVTPDVIEWTPQPQIPSTGPGPGPG